MVLTLDYLFNKIYYNCYLDGENHSIDAPIVVEGNKVTVKMSENKAVYRDVEVYMFQDQDNTQMHMYMLVKSFENFIGIITRKKSEAPASLQNQNLGYYLVN